MTTLCPRMITMKRPRLQTIIFEVTQGCDHACLHCYNTWNHPAWQGARHNGSGDLYAEAPFLRLGHSISEGTKEEIQ
jgi:hypothetical protein